MTGPRQLPLRLEVLSRAAGLAVALLGGLVLFGWALDIAFLKSVLPSLVTTKANTAVGLLLGGAALLLLASESQGRRRAAQACAAAMLLVGALTLAEHLLGWDAGIDQIVFRSGAREIGTAAAGRMAPETAASFVLLGLALLLLDVETRGGRRPTQALVLLPALVALLALLAHLYGVGASMRMAVHTAAGLLLLSTGVLAARPERGWMALFTRDTGGGLLARRLLAPVVLLPVALGWLRLEGQRAGLFGLETGLALFAGANIAILTLLLLGCARQIDRAEAQRRTADSLFRSFVESAPDALVLVDRPGAIQLVNAQAERLFGYERGSLAGQPIELLIPERFRSEHAEHRPAYVAAPHSRVMGPELDLHARRRDGSEFPVEISLGPVETEQGLFVCAAIRDVTARRETETQLRRRARQQEAVATLGQRALSGADIETLMDKAVAVVAATLDVELSKVLELRPQGHELVLRAGVGWHAGLVGRATVHAGRDSQAGYTLHIDDAVVVEDSASETRFTAPALLREHGVVAGISAVIAGHERPFGVLGAHSRRPYRFSPDDVHFVQSVANVLAEAIERKRAEQALERSEESLSEAQRVAHMGNWDWDVRTGELRWSAEVYRIFGLTPQKFGATYEAFLRCVHPDDRPQVEEAVRAAVDQRAPYSIEHRVLRPDAAERVVHEEGQVSFDDTGQPLRMIGTVQDVTERRRLEELKRRSDEIEGQNLRIQEASRLKSEFLANMSHELRTPLNAILGFAQLMHDGKVGSVSAEHKEYLGDILGSGRHLLQLVNDILDLAKVESGKMEFRPEPVDLPKLVGEVRDILRTVSAEKRVLVESRVDPLLSGVVADPRRLKQVLYNYLSNAVKFSPEEGRVGIRLGPEGPDAYRLEVEDAGAGIRPEDLGRLFVEFQQLDNGAAKSQPGTGLGLALTRRIVEAQNGHVGVRSTPGVGSVFFAVLPRRPREALAEPKEVAAQPQAADPLVLVVEDQAQDRAWLEATLGEAGYAVLSVQSGSEALARCRDTAFDAIVLDILLPDMSGWDTLRAIRAAGLNRDTPTIVSTVVTEKGAGAGFTIHDFLTKPVQAEDLLASLTRAGVPPGFVRPILVVEDDPADRRLVETLLGQLGYRPLARSDGASALQAAAEDPPAAVVLDLVMPGMDGFGFLERFRQMPIGRRTPVIVWTAHDLTAAVLSRLAKSAQAVVEKSRGAEALLEELRAVLPPRAGTRRELQ